MKSFRILLIFFLLLSGFISSGQNTRVNLELREFLQSMDSREMVPLLVEGDQNQLSSVIESFGGEVRLQIGKLYSINIPAAAVMDFSKSEWLEKIEFSNAPAHFLNDTMLIQTRADLVQQMAAPLRQQYNGKGVVLGVIDSGVELAHPDFQDSLGNTRVLYVWDQGVAYNPSRKPANYNYGVEWDSSSINNNISTHDDKASEFGHGSMVTGAAASNGLATGHFKGIAPEVNIISVATDFTKSNWLQTVAEAVDYIYTKADSLGMPCVINASIGTYLGSHDGEDIAARMIEHMIKAKSGRALVAAAGNAGQFKFHLQQQPNQDTLFTWMEYESQLFSGQGGLYYQIWADSSDMQNLQFAFGADRNVNNVYQFRGRTAFDSIQNRLNTIVTDSIMSLDNNLLAYVYTYAEKSQGRYLLEVAIPQPDSNQYFFRLETSGQGKIDIWSSLQLTGTSDIVNQNLPSVQQYAAMQKYVKADSLQTMVSSFTCLPSVITVGNYINRSSYIDVQGNQQNVNVTPGEISPNSSLGPNRRGYLKPDISSAGDYMFSAGRLATIATTIQTTPSKISFDSLHMRNGGTSMAAPTVAGMIALYLEQCSGADYVKIKNDLLQSHRTDAFSASAPSPKWGIGKADAFAFINSNVFQPQITIPLPDYCDGDTAVLGLGANYQSYQWNTGDTSAFLSVTTPDTFYVEVNNGVCKSVSDSISILFKPSPPKTFIVQSNDSLIIQQSGNFRWYYQASLIPGQFDSILVVSQNGLYHAELIGNNGCLTPSDTVNYQLTTTAEFARDDIIVYPNPTEDILNLKALRDFEEVSLMQIDGSIVLQFISVTSGQLLELKLGHLERGVYILQLKTPEYVKREKILKW